MFNPNGPDKSDMEVYLVHDGDNLMDTITTAIVSAGLK
jgi:cellobiose-specific phosphotransferase system component IIA